MNMMEVKNIDMISEDIEARIENVDKHIGAKILELRLSRGMSRQQLASMIGVSHQQTQKYEKGVNRISASRLYIIAQALGQNVKVFYEGLDTGENCTVPDSHQRMCIEISRNFLRIRKPLHQTAVNTLIKTLAE
jgi:transcriptional regulator with XRE-family HTH domain